VGKEMDGWMGGWVNVQHTLALESYKHKKALFLVALIFLNFYFYIFSFFLMFFRGPWNILSFVFWTPYLKKTNIERHFFKGLKYFLILLYIIYDFLKNVLSGPCVTCSGRTQCAWSRQGSTWSCDSPSPG